MNVKCLYRSVRPAARLTNGLNTLLFLILRMSVSNISIDIVGYSGTKDFHVYTEFIDENDYDIVVKRCDSSSKGWEERLEVFVVYTTTNKTQTIVIGPSSEPIRRVRITTDTKLVKGAAVQGRIVHEPLPFTVPQRISRHAFNTLFDTDIVELPKNMFAVGIYKDNVYLYNQTYEFYYMIDLVVRHMIGVALQEKLYKKIHWVMCAYDGYMEGHYLSRRFVPKSIEDTACKDMNMLIMSESNTYPIFYKEKWIVAQSNQHHVPYTIDMPDRYYFYLNRYNAYRSIHGGIPFDDKLPMIVYGSQPRGSKYNFTRRYDIELSQRDYFYSDAVPKTNIHAPKWIDRETMIKYKYILDIDGNASTWDATAWKLNSGSVILKTESAWHQWFYLDYKPWTHYVPVKDDFSDIQQRFTWCEAHPNECRAMIARNMELFQKAYNYSNVIDYTLKQLVRIQGMPYYQVNTNRIFPFTIGDARVDGIQCAKLNFPHRLQAAKYMCSKLNDSDYVLFFNASLTDVCAFTPTVLFETYKTFKKDIVFGAEKNLWPGSLEPHRQVLIGCAGSTEFKYLNSGFYIARVSALRKLLKEFIWPDSNNDQEYFTKAYLTGRYDIALDYAVNLVLNTYLCSGEEIAAKKAENIQFIHYNGGR